MMFRLARGSVREVATLGHQLKFTSPRMSALCSRASRSLSSELRYLMQGGTHKFGRGNHCSVSVFS